MFANKVDEAISWFAFVIQENNYFQTQFFWATQNPEVHDSLIFYLASA